MFEGIIGNNEVKKSLKESIKLNNIAHSYIFNGIPGIGKRMIALEFVKKLMCLDKGKCKNNCDSCIKFDSNNNTDFLIIEPESKVIKINQIRELQENISIKPTISKRKTYIINDADLMTEESQNCLLKTLEEPPEYALIILIISNESRILPTIKSRCVNIKFNKIKDDELKEHLNTFTREQIKLLNGSLANVETIEKKQDEYEKIKVIVKQLCRGTLLDLIENSELLYNEKDNIQDILNCLNIVLLENKIIEPIKYIENTKRKIKFNNNYEMCIDYLLINSWNSINSR